MGSEKRTSMVSTEVGLADGTFRNSVIAGGVTSANRARLRVLRFPARSSTTRSISCAPGLGSVMAAEKVWPDTVAWARVRPLW